MEDCDGDCVDDMIDIFEEYMKKSFFLVSITFGAIIIMVLYVLNVFSDRGTHVTSQAMPPLTQTQSDIQMLSMRPLTPRAQIMSPVKRSPPAKQRSLDTQIKQDTTRLPETQMLQDSSTPATESPSAKLSQYALVQPYDNVTQLAPPGYKSPATSAPSQQTRRIQYDISSQNSGQSNADSSRPPSANAVTQFVADDILLNVKPTDYLPKSYFKNTALKQNIDELSPRSSDVALKVSPTINDSNESRYYKRTENDSGSVSSSQAKPTCNNLDKNNMKPPDNYTDDSKKMFTNENESKINSDIRSCLNSPDDQSNQNVRINIVLENTEHGLEPKVTCTNFKMINVSDSNKDEYNDNKFVYPSNDQHHQKIRINIKVETPELLGGETSNTQLLNAIYRDPAIENADSIKTKTSYYSAQFEADKACKTDSDGRLEGNHSVSNETTNAVHSYDHESSSHSKSPPRNEGAASGKSRNTQTVEFLPMHYSDVGRSSFKRYSNPNFRTCSITDCYPPCSRSQSFTYIPQTRGSCCSICCENY